MPHADAVSKAARLSGYVKMGFLVARDTPDGYRVFVFTEVGKKVFAEVDQLPRYQASEFTVPRNKRSNWNVHRHPPDATPNTSQRGMFDSEPVS